MYAILFFLFYLVPFGISSYLLMSDIKKNGTVVGEFLIAIFVVFCPFLNILALHWCLVETGFYKKKLFKGQREK